MVAMDVTDSRDDEEEDSDMRVITHRLSGAKIVAKCRENIGLQLRSCLVHIFQILLSSIKTYENIYA
jgi:hypothetical protein